MTTANEQLKKIAQELQSTFNGSPIIKVMPLDEDPSEKYEIIYHLNGLVSDKDGKIMKTSKHSILINIPFGFPYFPPSCTPQTQTFHPDFDQAAICIGDFWNKDRALSALVIHIGRMIIGEVYSTENAFNDNAAHWYKKNADKLPLQNVTFPEIASPDQEGFNLPRSANLLNEEELIPTTADTLDELDFIEGPEINFSNPRKQTSDKISPSTDSHSLQKAKTLLKQKKFYELHTFLLNLPVTETFSNRESLTGEINQRVNQAKDLLLQSKDFEKKGQFDQALQLAKKIQERVPDFPKLNEYILRIEKKTTPSAQTSTTPLTQSTTSPAKNSKASQPEQAPAFFEEGKARSINIVPILGGGGILVILGIVVLIYFMAGSNLKKAENDYTLCQESISEQDYTTAQQLCSSADDRIAHVFLFKGKEAATLQEKIQNTLQSDNMIQGSSGKVQYQNQYISKDDMQKITVFSSEKEAADRFFAEENWVEASRHYKVALASIGNLAADITPPHLQSVKVNSEISAIHVLVDQGITLLNRDDLTESKEILKNALTRCENLSDEDSVDMVVQIKSKLKELEYLEYLNLGKKSFNTNDWETAVKQYEKALELQGGSLSGKDSKSLYSNMAEAELYALISKAKQAFSEEKLDQAVSYYQDAIELLQKKKEYLTLVNSSEIIKQLQRIILRTQIVQLKKKADTHMDEGKKQAAIADLNKVISVITKSGLAKDEEFHSIIQGTRKTIEETKIKVYKEKQLSYLEKNYIQLFQQNYSAAIPEYLSEPKATFLRKEGDKEIYQLQCLENNRGRKIRLLMIYSYDPEQDIWQFYNQNTQENL